MLEINEPWSRCGNNWSNNDFRKIKVKNVKRRTKEI